MSWGLFCILKIYSLWQSFYQGEKEQKDSRWRYYYAKKELVVGKEDFTEHKLLLFLEIRMRTSWFRRRFCLFVCLFLVMFMLLLNHKGLGILVL